MTMVHLPESEMAEVVEEMDLSTLTLEELAERVVADHQAVEAALGRALRHARSAGLALLDARSRFGVKGDGWKEWLDGRLPTSTATRYTRIAFYWDRVVAAEAQTTTEAYAAVVGLPFIDGHNRHPDWMRSEARRLRQEGLTLREIAERLGVSHGTVSPWLNPDRTRRKAREAAARRKALKEQQEREEKERLAREKGGNLGKAYDAVRKLQPVIDAAVAEGLSVEARALLVRVEDEIFKALKR